MKNILKIIFVFIVGIAGGIFADQVLWPYLSQRPFFSQYQFSKNQLAQLPTGAVEKEKITIEENTALQDAIERVEKAVVGVRNKNRNGENYIRLGFNCYLGRLNDHFSGACSSRGKFRFFC